MYKSYDQLGAQPEPDRDVMEVLELANPQHKKHIISTHRVVCIDIYADWCGPCKQTAPAYALVASNYSKLGHCAVVKYNLDKMNPAEKANIHGIPVFEFYVDGKQVDQIVGADIPQVEDKLKALLQGGSQRQQMPTVEDLTKGPIHSRNSIRNNRAQMPQMDPSAGEPYQPTSGNYHQPYQGQRQANMHSSQRPMNPAPDPRMYNQGPQIRYQ